MLTTPASNLYSILASSILQPRQHRIALLDQASTATANLAGLRVFMAEDEPLIAMLIEDALEELGCVTVGPYDSVGGALAAAREADFEVALVDFNLRGEKATPLAQVLCQLGRPFTIVSGAPTEVAGHGESAILGKPFKVEDIVSALTAMTQQSGTSR